MRIDYLDTVLKNHAVPSTDSLGFVSILLANNDAEQLSRYLNLGHLLEWRPIPARQGTVFYMRTASGEFAVKVVTDEPSRKMLEEKVALEVDASRNGIPVAEPIMIGGEGQYISQAGAGWFIKVNRWVPGKKLRELEVLSYEQAESIGALIAQLHRVAPPSRPGKAKWIKQLEGMFIGPVLVERENYAERARLARDAILQQEFRSPSYRFTHGDLDANLIMSPTGPVIIDWDEAGSGNIYREVLALALTCGMRRPPNGKGSNSIRGFSQFLVRIRRSRWSFGCRI